MNKNDNDTTTEATTAEIANSSSDSNPDTIIISSIAIDNSTVSTATDCNLNDTTSSLDKILLSNDIEMKQREIIHNSDTNSSTGSGSSNSSSSAISNNSITTRRFQSDKEHSAKVSQLLLSNKMELLKVRNRTCGFL